MAARVTRDVGSTPSGDVVPLTEGYVHLKGIVSASSDVEMALGRAPSVDVVISECHAPVLLGLNSGYIEKVVIYAEINTNALEEVCNMSRTTIAKYNASSVIAKIRPRFTLRANGI
ncbi:hypothetical protein EVAR_36302_1 [Eumeta japonica]|uniref:Uncharacterized protein n=1 Tax=Eumeta variegata TaxID=151549 RepID=A0A4C1VIE3_EUMVA|nr:hypothetical protein EVAR_36302_1 [Eumeta japonica]